MDEKQMLMPCHCPDCNGTRTARMHAIFWQSSGEAEQAKKVGTAPGAPKLEEFVQRPGGLGAMLAVRIPVMILSYAVLYGAMQLFSWIFHPAAHLARLIFIVFNIAFFVGYLLDLVFAWRSQKARIEAYPMRVNAFNRVKEEYPKDWEDWKHSRVCLDCGHVFIDPDRIPDEEEEAE